MRALLFSPLLAMGLWCAAPACADITVHDPWVRVPVPGQKVAGAYMQITSDKTAFLVSASSLAAKAVEIHEMAMDNNVMKMRPIPRLELPAGKAIVLKPGGYHVMLIDLKRDLVNGDTVPLTLRFEGKDKASEIVEVKARVRPLDVANGVQHMH